jgi:hypothetical protein
VPVPVLDRIDRGGLDDLAATLVHSGGESSDEGGRVDVALVVESHRRTDRRGQGRLDGSYLVA